MQVVNSEEDVEEHILRMLSTRIGVTMMYSSYCCSEYEHVLIAYTRLLSMESNNYLHRIWL